MKLQVFTAVILSLFLFNSKLITCAFDYSDALQKSILFFEGMRSGPVTKTQRVTWRQSSGMTDGKDCKVDLVGGYYDAGDNEKFGLPMAFTATMLSWSIIEGGDQMDSAGQLGHAKEAVRWATDYFLKAYRAPNELYAQVGNPSISHSCWQRPEDMDTPRTCYKVDDKHPGSDVAGETAAALAAASIVFQVSDPSYSQKLLIAAKGLFTFADKYRGTYSDALGDAVNSFYKSFSGFKDELLWGAAWLYKATRDESYLSYVTENGASLGGTTSTNFATTWDNKLPGVQILLSRVLFLSKSSKELQGYKTKADEFVCSILPGNSKSSSTYTPGGLLYVQPATNLQYVTSNAFVFLAYAKYLKDASQTVSCGDKSYKPEDLVAFSKRQVDYILGENPKKLSYMVGFGSSYPTKIHQRSSSLPSMKDHPGKIACSEGFEWMKSSKPNPNPQVGAVVGGPDKSDEYDNDRADFAQSEPATYINAPMVGACALLL